ncbi:MAG TPA: hypothetical protein DCG48_02690, partial [Rhodospirillaceae bacterium]|nr:hypothetical protein [Rhodospirillaceae bacterium]
MKYPFSAQRFHLPKNTLHQWHSNTNERRPTRAEKGSTKRMKLNQKHVLVCDCEGTMPIDGEALAKACGRGAEAEGDLKVATHLCRRQIEEFQRVAGIAAEADETLLVACTQEA